MNICPKDNVPAFSSITSVGAALGNKLFSPKTDAPIPTITRLHKDLRFIDKLHLCFWKLKGIRLGSGGGYTHLFSISSPLPVFHNAFDFGKEGIIPSHPYVFPGMDSSSYLTNQDTSGLDLFSAEPFDAQTLSSAVPAIP